MSKPSIPVRLAGLAMILAWLIGASPPLARADDGGAGPELPSGIDEFYVDRSDDANVSTCTSAPNNCTLRGAINKVNTDGIVNATIRFSSTVTQIDLTTPLPALSTTGTYILGGPRLSGAAMASGSMMTIDTSQVEISGLTFINGVERDISVLSGSGNVIRQNTIGVTTTVADACLLTGVTRASPIGIYVGPAVTGNSAAPSVWIYDNDINCHAVYGIQADGADGLIIGVDPIDSSSAKNYIGTNWQSDVLGNGIGIALMANGANGAKNNQIRYNWIWNSASQGIWLNGTGSNTVNSTASNIIAGNSIRGNGRIVAASGIRLTAGAYWNAIGGTTAAEANRIYNNTGNGIRIEGSDLNGVLGNVIGESPSYPGNNTGHGVLIDAAKDSWIGAYPLGLQAGNEIGGNGGDGIHLQNVARNTKITRNLIGSDSYGAPRPNGASGIVIESGSYSTTVGTGSFEDRNVIAGNASHGIFILGSTTTSNTIRLNDIGINRAPALKGCPCEVAVPNGGVGLYIRDDAHHNRAYDGNAIAHNAGGVLFQAGAHDNQIGPLDEVYSNSGSGVRFSSSSQFNRLDGMWIYNNSKDGIEQYSTASNNSWINTATYLNGGLGIDIATVADDNIPTAGYPVITSVVRAGGVVTVTGTSDTTFSGLTYRTTTVYLFHGGLDPSGYGEGRTLAGSANTNASGVWRVVYSEGGTPLCYAAYKRIVGFNGASFYDAGSEFSRSTCGPAYVPMVVR